MCHRCEHVFIPCHIWTSVTSFGLPDHSSALNLFNIYSSSQPSFPSGNEYQWGAYTLLFCEHIASNFAQIFWGGFFIWARARSYSLGYWAVHIGFHSHPISVLHRCTTPPGICSWLVSFMPMSTCPMLRLTSRNTLLGCSEIIRPSLQVEDVEDTSSSDTESYGDELDVDESPWYSPYGMSIQSRHLWNSNWRHWSERLEVLVMGPFCSLHMVLE